MSVKHQNLRETPKVWKSQEGFRRAAYARRRCGRLSDKELKLRGNGGGGKNGTKESEDEP